ncbi:MAG TPA: hypothetical protein PKD55_07915 [Bellilinea sp.]|nr:hypothetical protein [Bellilinea sp.]
MAKKQKRRVTPAGVSPEAVVPASSSGRVAAPVRAATTEFNPDYTYVKNDLRKIGILAGTFFVILIVLSFVL